MDRFLCGGTLINENYVVTGKCYVHRKIGQFTSQVDIFNIFRRATFFCRELKPISISCCSRSLHPRSKYSQGWIFTRLCSFG